MTTIDTITTEQIKALRAEARSAGDTDMVQLTYLAVGRPLNIYGENSPKITQADIDAARAECAKAIQAAEAMA